MKPGKPPKFREQALRRAKGLNSASRVLKKAVKAYFHTTCETKPSSEKAKTP